MPLYAIIYLFLFFLFAFGSTYMHFEEGRGFKMVVLEIISYSFSISFLIFYFEPERFQVSSFIILAMVLYSIAWEYFSFKQDVKIAKNDFGIKERELMVYTSVALGFLLPVYLAAFALIF